MKKNEIYTVKIEDMTNLGFGVAKIDGKVVFVDGAVTDDVAEVKIIKVQSSYAICKTERLITPGALRLSEGKERCKNRLCTGCAYKLISYKSECAIKEKTVRQAFVKEGLEHLTVAPLVASPLEIHYRNKAQYPIAKTKDGDYAIGFYKPKTHNVKEAADCPLAPTVFCDILETLRAFFRKYKLTVYDESSGKGLLRHVYLRRGEISGEILLTLVATEDTVPHCRELCDTLTSRFPEIVGILLNKNADSTNVILGDKYTLLTGRDYIIDTLAGVQLKLSAPAFYQVNHGAAELLYAKAKELANPKKSDTLLDLYCGVGSIGLSMARDVKELIGIEIVKSAVECAGYNAKLNAIDNAQFYTGDAKDCEKLLDTAEESLGRKINPDIIVLDPPRAGCDERLLRFISSLSAKKIVYISCNPATLARDVRILIGHGYTPGDVTPFDLFPCTGHVESVLCLTRE